MSDVTVRPARPGDAADILRLVRALADYEKLDPPDEAAQHRLIEDAFAPKPRFEVFLVELGSGEGDGGRGDSRDPVIVGYAFVFETYSTFLALPTLYLEDLFVLPEYRGQKAGLALFKYVVHEAQERGCGRVDFAVLDWNQLARDFYHKLGAQHLQDWCCYRLTREQFGRVLGGVPNE